MTHFTARSYRTLAAFVAAQIALFALVDSLVRTEVALSTPIESAATVSTFTDTRPSWENNLNWWIEGNDAVAVLELRPRSTL